jgi:micrococcal nuclease
MKHQQYVYDARLLEVVDGDTADFQVDLGFNVFHRVRVRLADIDTAEIYGTEADSAEHKIGDRQAAFAKTWMMAADQLTIETIEDDTGKYGRYLAHVWADGEKLSEALRDEFPDYFTK